MKVREHSLAALAVSLNLSLPTSPIYRVAIQTLGKPTQAPDVEMSTHESERSLLGYLQADTVSRYQPDVSSTVTDSLADFFVCFLPSDRSIERVCWTFDGPRLRVWTIIPAPDDLLEERIYDAQLRFMDKFPDLSFDFVVLYRFGNPIEDVCPTGVTQVPMPT